MLGTRRGVGGSRPFVLRVGGFHFFLGEAVGGFGGGDSFRGGSVEYHQGGVVDCVDSGEGGGDHELEHFDRAAEEDAAGVGNVVGDVDDLPVGQGGAVAGLEELVVGAAADEADGQIR